MRTLLQRIGKFYSGIIIKNIGIFIFVGCFSVLFMEEGWFPNENIYAISQLVYKVVLPLLIGYEAGRKVAEHPGGMAGVMTVAGVITADETIGILGAMIAAPAAAAGLKYARRILEKHIRNGMEMLAGNLLVGAVGGMFAIGAYYLAAPCLTVIEGVFAAGVGFLIQHKWIGLLSIIIEPAKVLFLNNAIHHGILVPLGIAQAEQAGRSVLFLLETNPGPGLGVLLALYLRKKECRREYASGMFVQFIGGIHEVYFPYVLSNLWLLAALIAGGMAGNFCFLWLDAGTAAPVSPGSILTILLLSGKGMVWKIMTGVLVSLLVSCGVGSLILWIQQINQNRKWKPEYSEKPVFYGEWKPEYSEKPDFCGMENQRIEESLEICNSAFEAQRNRQEERKIEEEKPKMMEQEETAEECKISAIGFICDAGVGSSAMGAALLRRKMKQQGVEGITVSAYAADQIPPGLDILVCQKDYRKHLPDAFQGMKIYEVESLLNEGEFETLIQNIKRKTNDAETG